MQFLYEVISMAEITRLPKLSFLDKIHNPAKLHDNLLGEVTHPNENRLSEITISAQISETVQNQFFHFLIDVLGNCHYAQEI